MKAFKNIAVFLLAGSFILPACHKVCHDKVITEKDIPLEGGQEVPRKISKAYGWVDVSYNKRSKVLHYKIRWFNLTGLPIGSHIHGEAPRGVNAPVKHDFTAPLPKVISGEYEGSVLVDEVAIKEAGLLGGLYYFNIHTPTNPGGEIRGQIEFD